ncbi:acetyl-CoA acetyltransferase [candidate division MSBL1 archaeon SCGC-AAA259D14]|uniref:Acetyl-CoA acetyltransferase n=2 Tax=candidate division MSBL1 TaxID=215777 RepID=A0A133U8W9_9EURY|nr:acetyl-CoA acetyltransferase [candidate division MSBL1 archaeon SCGC-AAA259D14]KXA93837.1 acetyl-CoA acetyltransferase [candidate division MSBL1 archaeon SCGC-AAA259E22]
MSRKVAVVGAGQSEFGNRLDVDIKELSAESFVEALEDTENLEKKDIEFASIGSVGAGLMFEEGLVAPLLCEYLGLNPIGTQRTEAACASGMSAVYLIYNMIASGQIDIGLAMGTEKMTEITTPLMMEFIGRAGSYFWEFENFGPTFPGYYAIYATAHMAKYGTTEEDFARVAVKNHKYGALNEKSYLRKEIDIETAMNSDIIAWPLKLYYCCPINDGAASIIMASEEKAKELTDSPVWITGLGSGTSPVNLANRKSFTSIESARVAAEKAYDMAGVGPDDVDVASVHDCFESAEIMAYEDLGFCENGEGKELIREKQTYADGDIPVNLGGGLKSKGHPIGATGAAMIYELHKQLLEKAKPSDRQASIDNGVALAHNVGGTGHYTFVTILER